MVGSLLQLAATSVENVFLTNDPEITLFKTVYRRHTNFSKEEKKLNFLNKMDFGKKGMCRLLPYADFIGQLYLVIKIPTVDINYKLLKIGDVKSILQSNSITWNTTDSDTTAINDSHLIEIQTTIQNYALILQEEKDIIKHNTNDDILTVIDNVYNDGAIADNDFYEELLTQIIKFDPNYAIVFELLQAYKTDETVIDNTFTNLKQLKTILFDIFKEKIIPNDNTSYHDENINLLDIVYRHTFPINTVDVGISSKTHFVNTLAQIYNGSSDEYTTFDSFKILEQYLTAKKTTIGNIFDVTEIKDDIFNHILYDVGKNIQLLIKIYNNLGLAYRFTFYKRYLYSATTESNSSNEEFINLSTTNISRFNDNFTNNFTLNPVESEPDNLTHFYSDYVQSFITTFHVNNRNYFRIAKYEEYFANTTLWKKMDLLTLMPEIDAEQGDKLKQFYILDLVPRVLISDINEAFIFIFGSTLEITGIDAPNLIGLSTKLAEIITPLVATLQTEIKVSDIISESDITLLFTLSNIYRKNTDNDIFVVGFFKYFKFFTYKDTAYNVMEYIRQIYLHRTITMIEEYESEREKLILGTNLSWITFNEADIGTSSTARNMYITLNATSGALFNQGSVIGNYFFVYSAYDTTKYTVWYNVDTNNIEPTIDNSTLLEVNILSSDDSSDIIAKTVTIFDTISSFIVSAANNVLNIRNATVGVCTPPTFSNMPSRMTLEETVTGFGSDTVGAARVVTITAQPPENYVTTGEANYFLLFNANNETNYYVWLQTSPETSNPGLNEFNELFVDISSATTATEVAAAIASVVDSDGHFTATNIDEVITITNVANGTSGQGIIGDSSATNYKAIINIVDMFFMTDNEKADDIETILPEYIKYKSNSLSLFQINNSRVQFLNPLGSTSDEAIVIDAPSSMWYNIYTKLITNYNNFYDKQILLNSYINNYLGKNIIEFKAYIDKNEEADIFQSLTIGDGDDYEVNYYLASSEQTEKITNSISGYLSTQLNSLNTLITLHNENKNILKISYATIPISTSLFETFDNMYTVFQDIIYSSFDSVTISESEPNSGYEHTPTLIDFNAVKTLLQSSGTIGIMDKFNALDAIKDIFYDITEDAGSLTPLELEIKTSVLYNSTIKNTSTAQRIILKEKYDSLFSSITSTTLGNDINNIVNNFNSFTKESDLYNYMIAVIKKASILNPIINLKKSTRVATYNAILEYYNGRIIVLDSLLNTINGTTDTSSLYTSISDMKKGIVTPKFAWVENLGHYIVDNTYIDLGGEIIDKQTGEWLQINNELTLPHGKKRGYNRLIGNVPEMHTYNNIKKKEMTLYIPLQHWFCKKISSILPIIAMNHTYANLHVNLKELGECSYWEDLTYFKKRPQLSAYVLADYYYVEPSERKNIVKGKHEMLIETVQIHNNIHVNSYGLDDNKSGTHKLYFQGSCKEYLWIAQKNTYENGTYLSPQTKYTFDKDGLVTTTTTIKKKSLHYYGENEDGTGNPLKQIKFNFNGVSREKFKDSMVYDTIYPHKCHTQIPSTGIMTYPLCLYPEHIQPSGTANNSQIDDVEMSYIVTDKTYNEMVSSKTVLRFAFYAISYNILRIMSGMAGLAFLES